MFSNRHFNLLGIPDHWILFLVQPKCLIALEIYTLCIRYQTLTNIIITHCQLFELQKKIKKHYSEGIWTLYYIGLCKDSITNSYTKEIYTKQHHKEISLFMYSLDLQANILILLKYQYMIPIQKRRMKQLKIVKNNFFLWTKYSCYKKQRNFISWKYFSYIIFFYKINCALWFQWKTFIKANYNLFKMCGHIRIHARYL